jgi:hypothetical protein
MGFEAIVIYLELEFSRGDAASSQDHVDNVKNASG